MMAKDTAEYVMLADLTDAEIERIEAMLFCAGGPPCVIGGAMAARATEAHPMRAHPMRVSAPRR